MSQLLRLCFKEGRNKKSLDILLANDQIDISFQTSYSSIWLEFFNAAIIGSFKVFSSVVILYYILYVFSFYFVLFCVHMVTWYYNSYVQFWDQDLNFMHPILFLDSVPILPTEIDFCFTFKAVSTFNFLTPLLVS